MDADDELSIWTSSKPVNRHLDPLLNARKRRVPAEDRRIPDQVSEEDCRGFEWVKSQFWKGIPHVAHGESNIEIPLQLPGCPLPYPGIQLSRLGGGKWPVFEDFPCVIHIHGPRCGLAIKSQRVVAPSCLVGY